MISEMIIDWVKTKERILYNTKFCKFWRSGHDSCVGCSSEKGCRLYGIIMAWESFMLDEVIKEMESDDEQPEEL